MTKIPRHADRELLFQVLGTVALLVMAFVEIALGQYPVFFGSTPQIMLMTAVLTLIYLPVALPLIAIVLAGIIFDLVQGAPLGFSTGMLVLASMVVLSRRSMLIHADASTVWYEFALILFGVQVYSLVIITLWAGEVPAVRPLLSQYGITVLLFPVLNWMLAPIRLFDLVERPS
ncbi:MAG: hypothetical protein ACON4P_07235 [Candidatus Puniceispirillales bacterium]